jgi:hypothetical protein
MGGVAPVGVYVVIRASLETGWVLAPSEDVVESAPLEGVLESAPSEGVLEQLVTVLEVQLLGPKVLQFEQVHCWWHRHIPNRESWKVDA